MISVEVAVPAQKNNAPHKRPRKGLNRAASLIRRDANCSIKDGCAYSVMAGLGEQYLPAFALAAGLGEVNAGLLSTVPLLVGAVAQLVSPAGVRYFGSYRRWVVICAVIQGASFIPFVIAALMGSIPASVAFLFAGLYWGAGLSISASWNTWMGTVIPSRFRTKFFSTRNRYVQISGMLGFLVGGLILNSKEASPRSTFAFAFVFAIAFFARLLSSYWLSRLSEPTPPRANAMKDISLFQFAQRFKLKDESAKLLTYMLCVQLTAHTASPFFTPFMLSQLHFNYSQFVALIAINFAAKILILPLLSQLVARRGAPEILWLGGLGIVVTPALWLISGNFWYLMGVQFAAGFFWAAFELCTVLLIIDRIPQTERVGLLTNYNLLNALSMVAGSMIGAMIIDVLGKNIQAYHVLFVVSFFARAISIYFLNQVTISRKLKWIGVPTFAELRRTTELLTLPHIPKVLRPRKRVTKKDHRKVA